MVLVCVGHDKHQRENQEKQILSRKNHFHLNTTQSEQQCCSGIIKTEILSAKIIIRFCTADIKEAFTMAFKAQIFAHIYAQLCRKLRANQ